MNKKKIFLIIGVLILIISVPLAVIFLNQKTIFKLGAQSQDRPENVQILSITEREATIAWNTQKPTQGLINYGSSPSNLTLIQAETSPVINHRVNLLGLLPGTNYFFVIKINDKTFDNNGQPFSFTTKIREVSPTPIPPKQETPLTEEGFQTMLGTNNPTYDLNKDGIVNTLDLLLFRERQNK
jgi:hypothetical protein